jgi:hypothetical protein
MHTSCTQSFARIKLMLKSYLTIYKSKLCVKVVCISYVIPKIETRGEKKLSRKGNFARGGNRSLGAP